MQPSSIDADLAAHEIDDSSQTLILINSANLLANQISLASQRTIPRAELATPSVL